MKIPKKLILAGGVSVLLSSAASAVLWTEAPDAGDIVSTSAQTTVGAGALTLISGSLADAGDQTDAYIISITDPLNFYATNDPAIDATAIGGGDTRMYLFQLDGSPVMTGDDTGNAGNHSLISTPSLYAGLSTGGALDGSAPASLAAGDYILAITGWQNDPSSGGNPTFVAPGPFANLYGSAGNGPVDAWNNGGPNITDYSIALRGASFSQIPEPGSAMLLGLASVAVFFRRRR